MISSDVTGIIAEYNFFHNGHAKQLSIIKERYENTKVVAVMSGNFTQRGEAAFKQVEASGACCKSRRRFGYRASVCVRYQQR